jgi:ketosteroid isomerase-like protein
MPQENVEIVRRGYQHFISQGEFLEELVDPRLVWDMSTFRGWPERQIYEGLDGAREFMNNWLETWEDWELSLEDLHDAGDQVVAIVSQRGRSKATGLPVEMHFAQVWTLRDGKQVRMEMYADPDEALRAVGLESRQ